MKYNPSSWTVRISLVKMAILPKAIPTKIPNIFSAEIKM
jgi:hypothetical protein